MRMRPGLLALCALPVLLSLAALSPAVAPALAAEPIVLGLVYNLTGEMASIDQPGLNGALLAVEAVNAKGGVLGRPLSPVMVDGHSDTHALSLAMAKFMADERPSAVCGLNDTTFVLAAAPPVLAAGVPFVTAGATWQGLPDLLGPGFFLAPFGDDAQAQAMARFTARTLKAKNVWVLSDLSHDFTRGLATDYIKEYVATGGQVLDEIRYATGETTFAAQTAALKTLPRQPEAVFLSAVPQDVPTAIPALRAAGYQGPILSGDGLDTPLLDALPAEQAGTVYFSTHVALDKKTPRVSGFVSDYAARYGAAPDSGFAALGHDAVMLVVAAMQRAGSAEPEAVRAALSQTRNFEGITGTITYPPGMRVPKKPVDIIRLENGRRSFAAGVNPE